MTVTFEFRPGQREKTPFGDVGFVETCAVGKRGNNFYVSRDKESKWFFPDELTAVEEATSDS